MASSTSSPIATRERRNRSALRTRLAAISENLRWSCSIRAGPRAIRDGELDSTRGQRGDHRLGAVVGDPIRQLGVHRLDGGGDRFEQYVGRREGEALELTGLGAAHLEQVVDQGLRAPRAAQHAAQRASEPRRVGALARALERGRDTRPRSPPADP